MTPPTHPCSQCNTAIPVGDLYCPACGAAAPTETGPQPAGPERASGRAWDPEPRRLEVQAALGAGFEVRRLVGRGGFGEVWAAFDVQLARAVAVKVLRAGLATSPEFVERFRREARAVARLRHPGIVPIYQVGEAAGLIYFTMPLVDGITLTAALGAEGGLSAGEAMRIIVEATAALHDAHSHGVVHRDLKPENLMLEGPQRRVLLMDFGIAQVQGSETSGLTETGIVLGSPEYMSPEQATGRALDERSDIYSLGVVAYRTLAGRLPFEADTPRAVLAHHVLTAPQPLAPAATVPAPFADAVMRCLAKDPAERWPSAEALLAALRGQAAAAAPTRAEVPVVRAPRPARAARRVAGFTALLLVLAAGALWPALRWRRHQAWTASALAVADAYRAAGDSLRPLAARFAAADSDGAAVLDLQEALLLGADARVDDDFGAALDDSARWPEAARQLVRAARDSLAAAGLLGARHGFGASDVPGCSLRAVGGATIASDGAARDNCWWPAAGPALAVSPAEYFLDFRVSEPWRPDAGLGLAWCLHAADCRVVFLWAAHAAEWGGHQPRTGLRAIQVGRAAALTPGPHHLRVRSRDGEIVVWLDGRELLRRQAALEAAYVERPATVHLVVQNAAVTLAGPEPLGMVGVAH